MTGKQRTRSYSLIGLYLLLVAVYLLSFKGIFFSSDELLLYDMTESFARRGNFDETLTYSLSPQRKEIPGNIFRSAESYEPLQAIMAAPLFLIAQAADINMMHGVFMLNVLITPLIAVVFYYGVRILDYDEATAWWTALLLGTGTLLVPYTQTFFREPLMTLFITTALVAALWIQHRDGGLMWKGPMLLLISLALAVLTKEISLLFLPAIGLFFLRGTLRNGLIPAAALILLIAMVIVLQELGIGGSNRFNPSGWSSYLNADDLGWAAESIRGYIYSPGRSFFIFSPVLLLSPWGMWLLVKHGECRLVAGMLITFVLFGAGYGLLRQHTWTGGWNLGPRYLLPLIPLFMFSLAPIVDRLLHDAQWRLWHMVVMGWLVLSVLLQLIFIIYSETEYYNSLSELDVLAQGLDIWTVRYAAVWQYVHHVNPADVLAFWEYSAWWWLIGVLLVLMISSELAGGLIAMPISNPLRHLMLGGVLIGVLVGGLSTVEDDRFTGKLPDTTDAIDYLETVATVDDAVILKDDRYTVPFGATYHVPGLVTTLPFLPGEIYSAGNVPLIAAGTTVELAGEDTIALIDFIGERYTRTWMVTYLSAFHTFARRPAERYLAENYFSLQYTTLSEDMHIAGFYMQPAPQGSPDIETDISFGQRFILRGYDLPGGDVYRPGDVVPVSLSFEIYEVIDLDFTVGVGIFSEAEGLVAQYDSLPVGGFERTTTWLPEQSYRDARALMLPDNLAPGAYQLIAFIYHWQNPVRLPVIDASGDSLPDIAVLQTIEVR